jgi:N-hydroxyarylamine O-acetyltransferase
MGQGSNSDEWEIERLDLDAYLRRVGHVGDTAPTAQTLAALHRAHLAAIPFENLDVVLGRGIAVDVDSVQAKLVERRRGGYCYEHGVLFAAVSSGSATRSSGWSPASAVRSSSARAPRPT